MELDDLKKQWKDTPTTSSAEAIREAIGKRISTFERSGRGIRNTFVIEMTIIGLIYLGFFIMMWVFQNGIQPYMYQIVIVTTVATIPVVWRLYKSQRWVNSMDYTVDVKTNIIAFVKYYRRTLLWYEWATYLIAIVIGVMLFFDADFQTLPRSIKITVAGYVFLISLLTRPYIRLVYGRRIRAFEDFLKE